MRFELGQSLEPTGRCRTMILTDRREVVLEAILRDRRGREGDAGPIHPDLLEVMLCFGMQ
jgi:hypothetical protein